MLLYRARSPAQLALWAPSPAPGRGKKIAGSGKPIEAPERAVAGCWDQTELRAAAIVLEGYAAEAEFPPQAASLETVAAEADRAGLAFVARVSGDLDALVARLAERHTGWFTRWRYELLLVGHAGRAGVSAGEELLLRFLVGGQARSPPGAWDII